MEYRNDRLVRVSLPFRVACSSTDEGTDLLTTRKHGAVTVGTRLRNIKKETRSPSTIPRRGGGLDEPR